MRLGQFMSGNKQEALLISVPFNIFLFQQLITEGKIGFESLLDCHCILGDRITVQNWSMALEAFNYSA